MISALARFYSNRLLHEGIISEEDREIHEYGLTAFLIFVCNYGTLLLLSVLTDRLTETIIFLLAYSIPRNIIGGWHAKTPLLCSICGIVMWAVVMILYHHLHLPEALLVVLSIACAATLSFLVSKKNRSERRKKLGYLLIVILSVIGVVSAIKGYWFSSLFLYALIANMIMNIPLINIRVAQ